MTKAKPWERSEKDTDKEWAAFIIFRDLLPEERCLPPVAKAIGKSVSLVTMWSSKYRWFSRVRAWDGYLDSRKREAELKALMKMHERQIQLALGLQSVGGAELQKLIAQVQESGKVSLMQAETVLKFIEQGTKLERLNRGEPGEIIQNKMEASDLDYTKLSNDELRTLRDLRRKLTDKEEA